MIRLPISELDHHTDQVTRTTYALIGVVSKVPAALLRHSVSTNKNLSPSSIMDLGLRRRYMGAQSRVQHWKN